MIAYAYKGALYCNACTENWKHNKLWHIADRLHVDAGSTVAREALLAQDTGDSDDYPQGPYADGGGESDSPQHCDSCGVFLQNPLTSDGMEYVREQLALHGDRLNIWGPYYLPEEWSALAEED